MAAAAAFFLGALPALAGADPVQWPTGPGTNPSLEASAHTLRFAGPDRYQTNLATALALRGGGDFPFNSPDRTGGEGPRLADAEHWWGAGSCPYSVLIVAGDTFADALGAASLSDPTNRSTEPWAERVAAADPVFDPVGGFDRVDTDGAPIIVTTSARQGAETLSASARVALSDLSAGGCTTAREAIIVGGEAAVSPSVASQILGLGYDEVFRIAGVDRYDTAARVAGALGTQAAQPGDCFDTDSRATARMSYYANAAIEFRPSATECRVLPRAVALADGGTGADALAAGWWTSFWQVPVLLVAPDGSLPESTRAALQTMEIDHLVVLGGIDRIPEATVDEAGAIAGAAVGRFAGADRYATAARMAQVFGGWYPSPTGSAGRGSMVCVASSSGSGPTAAGWPDALAAGPWCARAGGAAADPGAPARALPPVAGPHAAGHDVGGHRPGRDAVPILLTPVGATSLPESVRSLLQGTFDPGADWCSAHVAPGGCLEPGFGIVFGGRSVVGSAAEQELARLVSGDTYRDRGDQTPAQPRAFASRLDLSPVYGGFEGPGGRVCAARGGLVDLRWFVAWTDRRHREVDGALDLAAAGVYRTDADGAVRSEGRSAPTCVAVAGASVDAAGTSLSGRPTPGAALSLSDADGLWLSGAVVQSGAEPSHATVDDGGERLAWHFRGAPEGRVVVTEGDTSGEVLEVTLELLLRVSPGDAPDDFEALVNLETGLGPMVARISGEAVFDGRLWRFRGRSAADTDGVDAAPLVGGFRADLDTESSDRDTVAWQLDGFRPR